MMSGPGRTRPVWVNRVAEQYASGRPLAMLFDYDGTLTPLVRHPSLAHLPPGTRQTIRRLTGLPDVRVGVISGRALGDVQEMVGLDGVYYAGSGGLEVDLLGTKDRYPEMDDFGRLLEAIQDHLLEVLEKYPGTWLERKPGAMAIHFRGLLPLAATCFRYEMASLLAVVEPLRFRVVSEAIEVTPGDGWDKGTAVDSILSHIEGELGRRPVVVYFGDAANDVEGMAATAGRDGVIVGIGPDAPAVAELRLSGTDELADILDEMAVQLSARRGADTAPPPAPNGRASDPPATTAPVGEKPGVLLLDADEGERGKLAAALAALGWAVWQADAPEQAMRAVTRHGGAIRVALVDLQLPGLQGARALAALGKTRPDLIRAFMSADVSPYTAAAFQRLSAAPLFTKPFDVADLDAKLRGLLAAAPQT
jgi:trehalose 6-phosphate phosphatase